MGMDPDASRLQRLTVPGQAVALRQGQAASQVRNATVTETEKVVDYLDGAATKVGVDPADIITSRTGGEDDPWRRYAIGRRQEWTEPPAVDQECGVNPTLGAVEAKRVGVPRSDNLEHEGIAGPGRLVNDAGDDLVEKRLGQESFVAS